MLSLRFRKPHRCKPPLGAVQMLRGEHVALVGQGPLDGPPPKRKQASGTNRSWKSPVRNPRKPSANRTVNGPRRSNIRRRKAAPALAANRARAAALPAKFAMRPRSGRSTDSRLPLQRFCSDRPSPAAQRKALTWHIAPPTTFPSDSGRAPYASACGTSTPKAAPSFAATVKGRRHCFLSMPPNRRWPSGPSGQARLKAAW